jgi:hypothetical protein
VRSGLRWYAHAAVAIALLVVGLATSGCAPEFTSAPPNSRPSRSIAGLYGIGTSAERVRITALGGDRYRVDSPGFWEGVGIFDGHTYWGVFRYPANSRTAALGNVCGLHRAELQPDRSFKVHGSFNSQGFGEFDVIWNRLP